MGIELETRSVLGGTNTAENVTFLTNLTAKTESKKSFVPILPENKEGYNPESMFSLSKNENKTVSADDNSEKSQPKKSFWQSVKNVFKSGYNFVKNKIVKPVAKALSSLGTIGSTIVGAKYGSIAGKIFGGSFVLKKIATSSIFGKIIAAISAKNVIGACKVFGKIGGGILGLGLGLLASWGIGKLLEDKPQQQVASS